MKKRTYIVAAMAVAMSALVGCQKDFEPVADFEQATGSVARPEIGAVDLVLGAETRTTIGGNSSIDWGWETGDQVGAALVDQVNEDELEFFAKDGDAYYPAKWSYADYVKGTKTYEVANSTKKDFSFSSVLKKIDEKPTYVAAPSQDFYKRTQQTWTNYPYTYAGSKFTTPARLVEGHYVFYAPYNAALATRGPLVVTLPATQDVSEPTKAVADFYANEEGYPVVLGMKYLPANNTLSVEASTNHIFAYPQFTIVNNYDGYLFDGTTSKSGKSYVSTVPKSKTYTMKIKQVELYTNDENAFAYQREVKVDALYTAANESKDANNWDNNEKLYVTASTSTVLDGTNYGDANAFTAKQSPAAAFKDIDTTLPTPQKRIVLTFGKGVELAPGASYEFNAVVPAEDYTTIGLFARVLVEIDGAEYYIMSNEVANKSVYNADNVFSDMYVGTSESAGTKDYALITTTKFEPKDYQFADRYMQGSDNIVLVRGQRWPDAEVMADKTSGLKKSAGKLLTIDLVGGLAQAAVAKAVKVEVEDNGIANNEQFVDFLKEVHSDAMLTQVARADDVKTPNHFYLAQENEVIINAALVKALAQSQQNKTIQFRDNLPIASDVLVEEGDKEGEYVITAGDYTFTFKYDETAQGKFGTTAELVSGINIITTATQPLAMKKDNSNAVVFLKTNASIENPAGISGIVIDDENTLTVNAVVDAWIQAEEGTVTIEKNANVTNAQNVMATVNNKALAAFAGDAETVTYTCFGFGIDALPAASKVNALTVNPTQSNAKDIEIDNDALAVIANLKDVTITFGENVTGLTSAKDVKLTNVKGLKALKSGGILWKLSADAEIQVEYNDTEENKAKFFENIEEEEGVIFTPMK